MTEGREISKHRIGLVGESSYAELLSEIRRELQASRVKAVRAVNAELIALYWRIGRMILERQEAEGWGANVIGQLAADLKEEAPKGFSERNLHYMRAFAQAWPELKVAGPRNLQQVVAEIPWGHHVVLMTKLKVAEDRLWYAERAASEGWSRKVLEHHIATDLRGRHGLGPSNFESTLAAPTSDLAQELLADPLDLSFVSGEVAKDERDLELALLKDIETFMLNMGRGELAFVGRQKALVVNGDERFMDLLLFHTGLLCYVVVELKIGKFEPSYMGQLGYYVSAVDGEIRKENHGKTIGILLCTELNAQVVEYSIEGLEKPIGVATYAIDKDELTPELPTELRGKLPDPESLQAGLQSFVEEHSGKLEAFLGGDAEKIDVKKESSH